MLVSKKKTTGCRLMAMVSNSIYILPGHRFPLASLKLGARHNNGLIADFLRSCTMPGLPWIKPCGSLARNWQVKQLSYRVLDARLWRKFPTIANRKPIGRAGCDQWTEQSPVLPLDLPATLLSQLLDHPRKPSHGKTQHFAPSC